MVIGHWSFVIARASARAPMHSNEIAVCGVASVRAVFEQDPTTIKRLYFDEETSRKVAPITRYLAQQKRIYRVVSAEELEKLSGTVHHGGIVAAVHSPPLPVVSEDQLHDWIKARTPLLILDRIGNAHNLGAIARSAAFFGLQDVILPEHAQQARPGEAAHRVAEGGLARLRLWSVSRLPEFCRALGEHYDVLGASADARAQSISRWSSSRLRASTRPIALILGNEKEGLAPEIADVCTTLVHLPGKTDAVESLNVSVAAGILFWEIWGRRKANGEN